MRSTQNRNVLMLKIWLGTHALFADLTLKVNIFCLVKIRFWLSTETFDIQRALNIQSFTLTQCQFLGHVNSIGVLSAAPSRMLFLSLIL